MVNLFRRLLSSQCLRGRHGVLCEQLSECQCRCHSRCGNCQERRHGLCRQVSMRGRCKCSCRRGKK